jgi:hypothetical protein
MTFTRNVAVTAACLSLAAPAASASDSADQDRAPQREVCARTVYVKKRPGAIVAGTLMRGERVDVERYSASRRFVQIVARRPRNHTIRGWVPARYLCAEGQRAQFAKTSRYSVRIVNSRAGGDPGFLYVGGPANITVKDEQRAGQALTLCVTPAPTDRPSCRSGRTGHTIDTIVWSQPVATQVSIAIEGGPVLVDSVYPYAV